MSLYAPFLLLLGGCPVSSSALGLRLELSLTAHRNVERFCSHDIKILPFQLRRLFCVLSRYETLSATSDGYQMAFPASGFRLLRHLVSVDCECFASPLNCTLSRCGRIEFRCALPCCQGVFESRFHVVCHVVEVWSRVHFW